MPKPTELQCSSKLYYNDLHFCLFNQNPEFGINIRSWHDHFRNVKISLAYSVFHDIKDSTLGVAACTQLLTLLLKTHQ